jgi:hypothetical protein
VSARPKPPDVPGHPFRLFQGIYEDGLKALAAGFESRR